MVGEKLEGVRVGRVLGLDEDGATAANGGGGVEETRRGGWLVERL